MLEITMTINGKPLTSNNIENAFEKAIFETIKEHVRERLIGVPHELNGERLIVEVVGPDVNNISVQLSGPDELVEQAKVALGAE